MAELKYGGGDTIGVRLWANVGYTPEMIVPSIQRRPDLTEIVLFHGDGEKTEACLVAIEAVAKGFKIPSRRVLLKDVFSPVDSFARYLSEYRRTGKAARAEPILFNTAGGTGVLVATATAFCIAMGIPAIYVVRETGREVEYPMAMFGFRYGWLESHRRVLEAIVRGRNRVSDVAEEVRLTPARVSVLVQELEAHGYISSERTGREKRLEVHPFGRLVLEADALAHSGADGGARA